MTTTVTTVIDAFLATLDELRDTGLTEILKRQLAPAIDEMFCFVTIDRDHEIFTLAIDGAWAMLALELQQDRAQVGPDMELPRAALRAVVSGRSDADDRAIDVIPSITMSADGIPHISFGESTF